MMDAAGEARASSCKTWSVVYPVYINSKKAVAEGRRVAAGKACPDPTCAEIADCCSHLKIPCRIESDKAYPRDFMQVGRVRVQLKRDDGSPFNPEITTKKQLMLQVAELIPKHLGRTRKQELAVNPAVAPLKPGKNARKKK